jgi:hypothetical protein
MTSNYDVSRWGDSGRGERKVFVHPAGNTTGNLSLMRRGWYHKTIASALTHTHTHAHLARVYLSWSNPTRIALSSSCLFGASIGSSLWGIWKRWSREMIKKLSREKARTTASIPVSHREERQASEVAGRSSFCADLFSNLQDHCPKGQLKSLSNVWIVSGNPCEIDKRPNFFWRGQKELLRVNLYFFLRLLIIYFRLSRKLKQ